MKRIINIKPVSQAAAEKAKARVDNLVKPIGSLGLLEEYAVRLVRYLWQKPIWPG